MLQKKRSDLNMYESTKKYEVEKYEVVKVRCVQKAYLYACFLLQRVLYLLTITHYYHIIYVTIAENCVLKFRLSSFGPFILQTLL